MGIDTFDEAEEPRRQWYQKPALPIIIMVLLIFAAFLLLVKQCSAQRPQVEPTTTTTLLPSTIETSFTVSDIAEVACIRNLNEFQVKVFNKSKKSENFTIAVEITAEDSMDPLPATAVFQDVAPGSTVFESPTASYLPVEQLRCNIKAVETDRQILVFPSS